MADVRSKAKRRLTRLVAHTSAGSHPTSANARTSRASRGATDATNIQARLYVETEMGLRNKKKKKK